MAKYTFDQVKRNVSEIANRDHYSEDFIFELMAAYGRSAAAISQLRSGVINKAEKPGAFLQKGVIHYQTFPLGTPLEEKVEEMDFDPLSGRYDPRYIIATDLHKIVAKDTIKHTTLDIAIKDIDNEVAFFYGWTGNEISEGSSDESMADRRAADKMKDLYDSIERENIEEFQKDPLNFRHDLNVFFSRLLFCFFAEDTGLFKKRQFTDSVKDYTESDGSDLHLFFKDLFASLDSEDKTGMTTPFSEFPYVNGTLFNTKEHNILIPNFSPEARHLLILCSELNWSDVNPDIFGTIFQGIVDETKRDENGMDYTSVPNILKVINPLFMDELHEEFDKAYDSEKKLSDLYERIGKIKIFDPACGSGNFLIIAYKKMRELEHDIIRRIAELRGGILKLGLAPNIKLENFFGIELEDFPKELAVLSLYIAEHQMNVEFEKEFGKKINILPLIKLDTIHCGNSARLDWNEICPNKPHKKIVIDSMEQSGFFKNEAEQTKLSSEEYDEIYVIGNPPYKGSRSQTSEQKKDMDENLSDIEGYRYLDYIAIWFMKASKYISGTIAQSAFVSTNSICQGDQAGIFWPEIFNLNIKIQFAYTSFKWTNNASNVAGVTVCIISLADSSKIKKCKIYSDDIITDVPNINAYLSSGDNGVVLKSRDNLNGFPEMAKGSTCADGDFLSLSKQEANSLIASDQNVKKYIKKYTGSKEYINGIERFCLWIDDCDEQEAKKNEFINDRIEKVRQFRLDEKNPATIEMAKKPWSFFRKSYKPTNAIIVPVVSSERREYIPLGFVGPDTIISYAAFSVYDAEPWLFSILESKMHTAWIRTVCGKLKTDYRYSSTLGYNTFPCPQLTLNQKEKLNNSARNILFTRANHPELTLAEMYDPDKMPSDLRQAHDENDILVDKLYRSTPFQNDEARLAILFKLYEEMTKNK